MAGLTSQQRQQSLAAARRACETLSQYVVEARPPNDPIGIDIQCLVAEFTRLDAKEQLQAEAGREYGHLGGRPKKALRPEEEMTPRERARQIQWVGKTADELWEELEAAITSAVEAEREAIAKIVEAERAYDYAGNLAKRIRARSTADSAAPAEK
jgi:hypothetical protein